MSRFKPKLIKGQRCSFVGEVDKFIIEKIKTKQPTDYLPQVRLRLNNIYDENGKSIKIRDNTIPFSIILRRLGMPVSHEKIKFEARLQTDTHGKYDSFTHFGNPKYENNSNMLDDVTFRFPAFPNNDDLLIGAILKHYPFEYVQNKNGILKSQNPKSLEFCCYKFDKKVNQASKKKYIRLFFFNKLFRDKIVKVYRNINHYYDFVLIDAKTNQILSEEHLEDQIDKAIIQECQLSKADFINKFKTDDMLQNKTLENIYDSYSHQ